MRDQLIFVVAPYLAALAVVPVLVVRYVLWRRRPGGLSAALLEDDDESRVAKVFRSVIAVVLLGHLIVASLPAAVLRWNRLPWRMFALEGSGLIAGGIALLALLAIVVRRVRVQDRGPRSPLEVIAGTLMSVEVVSGIAIAILYRWASSWSVVTLSPYLLSLLRLDPSVVLIAQMPFLVRLHVVCAYAIIAVVPLTPLAQSVFLPAYRLTRWASVPVAAVCRPAWRVLEAWGAKGAQAAVMIRSEGEEN